MKNTTIYVTGMESTHCQTRVKRALDAIAGTNITNIEAGKLELTVDSEHTEEQVKSSIEKLGYEISAGHTVNDPTCTTGCCAD